MIGFVYTFWSLLSLAVVLIFSTVIVRGLLTEWGARHWFAAGIVLTWIGSGGTRAWWAVWRHLVDSGLKEEAAAMTDPYGS